MKKLLMLAVAAFAAGSAAAQMNQPIPVDPEVRTGKLENGMTYYIRHNEKPKGQADFYILHDVGAIQRTIRSRASPTSWNTWPSTEPRTSRANSSRVSGDRGREIRRQPQCRHELGLHVLQHEGRADLARGIIDSALLILHDWSHFIALEPEEIDSERGVIMEELRTATARRGVRP